MFKNSFTKRNKTKQIRRKITILCRVPLLRTRQRLQSSDWLRPFHADHHTEPLDLTGSNGSIFTPLSYQKNKNLLPMSSLLFSCTFAWPRISYPFPSPCPSPLPYPILRPLLRRMALAGIHPVDALLPPPLIATSVFFISF